jgi:hypothetical protein
VTELSPAETLLAAADRIKDLAARAVVGPWAQSLDAVYAGPDEAWKVADCHTSPTAAWIAALSPSVAEPIEAWLRHSAAMWEADTRRADLIGVAPGGFYIGVLEEQALTLARAVLGSGVVSP